MAVPPNLQARSLIPWQSHEAIHMLLATNFLNLLQFSVARLPALALALRHSLLDSGANEN